jgi:alpha/beta hydrolase fold
MRVGTAAGCTDGHLRVEVQLLLYPALDPRQQHASHAQFADGYLLTRSDMAFYWDNYLPAVADRSDPRAVPASITDFTGLPPAAVATAGFDPLHDEGPEYAQRLIAANVPTVYLPFPGLTHGFLDMSGRVPAAQRAADTVVQSLNLLLPPVARPSPATDRAPARELRKSQAHEPMTETATPLPNPTLLSRANLPQIRAAGRVTPSSSPPCPGQGRRGGTTVTTRYAFLPPDTCSAGRPAADSRPTAVQDTPHIARSRPDQ